MISVKFNKTHNLVEKITWCLLVINFEKKCPEFDLDVAGGVQQCHVQRSYLPKTIADGAQCRGLIKVRYYHRRIRA